MARGPIEQAGFRRLLAWSAVWVALLAGCAAPRVIGEDAAVEPLVARAPLVVVVEDRLAPDRDAACVRLAESEVVDHVAAAREAGMRGVDYEAIRGAARQQGISATFRDTNAACLPHLVAGVQSKDHRILAKTWDADSLDERHQHLAGLVSNLRQRPPRGVKVSDPALTLKDGEPVTCDYDLMDLLEQDGRRVLGETERDIAVRAALNRALPETQRGHRDRVLHGSQSEYPRYLARHPEEAPVAQVLRPEAPLTAFEADGRVFRLERLEDALNYYRCRGAGLPAHWKVVAEDREGRRHPVREGP